MKRSDFFYELPDELIARYPAAERSASRLLVLDGNNGQIEDRHFRDILELIEPNDLLVFNNTRVIPARLLGRKSTGGNVEILVERIVDTRTVLAHVRASKSPKPGTTLLINGQLQLTMLERRDDLFLLRFDGIDVLDALQLHGHMPLPPYIDRPDEAQDQERYQTVYAQQPGAVAAPTAGLHFDETIFAEMDRRNISRCFVTLHVGAGTFQPVRVENLAEHVMHAEYAVVEQAVCNAVRDCRARGGRVIAVGTTSVRSLESASHSGQLEPFSGDTRLFITPGYRFNVVDALLTNFHLPESTLLMLVSAFSGYDNIMRAYRHAIAAQYRFFSYGDAMLLTRQR